MKKIFLTVLLGLAMSTTSQAQISDSVWSDVTMLEPASGTVGVTTFRRKDLFFFVKRGTTQESGWLRLSYNSNVDICFDNDVAAEDDTVSTFTLEILHIPHGNLGVQPADDVRGQPLLGVVLDGTATSSGSTQDCIYDVKGKMWIKVANIVKDAGDDQDGLVSISARNY